MEDAGWRLCGRTCGSGPAVRRLHATRKEEDEDHGRRVRPPVQVCPAHLDSAVADSESSLLKQRL